MAAALGDLIRVTDIQIYDGEQVLNVYTYRVTAITGLGGDYLELFDDWFRTEVMTPVSQIQVTDLLHLSTRWENLSNGVDLYEDATIVAGTVTTGGGVLLPSYVNQTFKLLRESLVTRNGSKRYAGVPVTWIDGNAVTAGGAARAAVETALGEDIVIGLATAAEPVIWGSPRATAPVGAYEYSSISAGQFSRLGTQNTRKPGSGS